MIRYLKESDVRQLLTMPLALERVERAFNARTSALLELRIDPEAITPRTTLSAIRAEALKEKHK